MATKPRNLIILGSSRQYGNTYDVARHLASLINADIINLFGLDISYYDYDHKNQADDFLTIIEQMKSYDQIIMATPVYWYTMSAQLKTFFDRLSDLIRVEISLGRSLMGKTMYAMSCGSYDEIVQGFEVPFVKSAEYLHLNFGGYVHVWKSTPKISTEVLRLLEAFAHLINNYDQS